MTRLTVNGVADSDVADILRTLRRSGGPRTAATFDRDFEDLFFRLIQFPESGARRPKLGAGIRIGVVRPFVVFYRYHRRSDAVEILRVLDGRRDIDPKMLRV